jgi:hypothetical protein
MKALASGLGVASVVTAWTVVFVQYFSQVFRDVQLPMVIAIYAGIVSLASCAAFIGTLVISKKRPHGGFLFISLWLVAAAAVFWKEKAGDSEPAASEPAPTVYDFSR